MQARTQRFESDEAGSSFDGLAPLDISLDLPRRSLPATTPFPLLEAGTEARRCEAQHEVSKMASTVPSSGRPASQAMEELCLFAQSQSLPAGKSFQQHSTASVSRARETNKRAQQKFRQRQKVTHFDLESLSTRAWLGHLTTVQGTSCVIQAKLLQQEQELSTAKTQIGQMQENLEILKFLLTAEHEPIYRRVQTCEVTGIPPHISIEDVCSQLTIDGHISGCL